MVPEVEDCAADNAADQEYDGDSGEYRPG